MTLEEVRQLFDDLLCQLKMTREAGVLNLRKSGLSESQANNGMTIRQLFDAILLLERKSELKPTTALSLQDTAWIQRLDELEVSSVTALSLLDTTWLGRTNALQLTDTAWIQNVEEQKLKPTMES